MTLAGYLVGSFTVLASIFYFINQPLPHEIAPGNRTWWERFSQWALISHPGPSYSNLRLFGVAPDLILRASHSIAGTGFHRRYRLAVDVQREKDTSIEGCWIAAEWRMGRDVFVDPWLLHRLSPAVWTVSEPPLNIEVPSYSQAALPFILTARANLCNSTTSVTIDIPDLAPRYQLPSFDANVAIPRICPPRLTLKCPQDQELVARVEELAGRFLELEIQVPVAKPLAWVNYSTYGAVFGSLLYLLYHLHKA